MEHAWLDSLSEDWVSQPECDASADKLPPVKSSDNAKTPPRRAHQSRIPRRTPNARSSLSSTGNSSPCILSERTVNGSISTSTRRRPSKLSQEIKGTGADDSRRSMSTLASGSVVRHSVQRHESCWRKTETPEWKRRFVHGRMRYGEQRDLFCSAAAGLQDMFKPPAPHEDSEQLESTLPSSPPTSRPDVQLELERLAAADDRDPDNRAVVTPSPSPRQRPCEIKFKLNLGDTLPPSSAGVRPEASSTWDGLQPRDEIFRDESCLTAPLGAAGASRKTSDTRNEDFSPILIGKHGGEDGRVDFAPIEVPVEQLKQKLERLRINQILLGSRENVRAGFHGGQDAANFETTEEYMRNGGFVNMQRGGRSGEGSFYNRGLSSEIAVDSSDMLPEESLQANTPKQFPTVGTEASVPDATIHILHSPSLPRAPFPSPDKRQIEEAAGHTPSSPLKLFGPYDTFTNQTLLRRISQFEETSGSPSGQSLHAESQEEPLRPQRPPVRDTRAVSRFGGGDLDGYEFTGDLSYDASEQGLGPDDKENVAPAPALSTAPSLSRLRDSSPDDDQGLLIHRRRNRSLTPITVPATTSMSNQGAPSMALPSGAPASAATPKRVDSEAKRPRPSPFKDPTPKRRRTLHRSDVAFGREDQLIAVDSAHQQMQAVMDKKRKEDWPGGFEAADASVPAMRSVFWPRVPASGTRLPQHEKPTNPPTQALQNENVALPIGDGTERKPSIRTQDFVDQAAQIMAMIRSQVRPELKGLGGAGAKAGGSPGASLTSSCQDSTEEPFSRPPSREGKPLSRIPQRQEDPELVSRLKKYQERSDMGDATASSLRSTSLVHDGLRATDVDEQTGHGPIHVSGGVISDLPNVRITSSRIQSTEHLSPSKDFPTYSSGRSTSRTFPTASSRGSESRRTIMPESVSHLIPDRVGSMFLDKQNNIWIKRKGTRPATQSHGMPSEDSEDDPFASIPDLSVDMTRELQILRLATAQREAVVSEAELQRSPGSPLDQQPGRSYVTLSPKERPGPHMAAAAREQLERLEDRATTGSAGQGDAERDGTQASGSRWATRRRNLTISFSSPVASIIHDVVAEDLNGLEDDADSRHQGTPAGTFKSALRNGSQATRGRTFGPCRPPSSRGPCFVPRPVSRIDEQDEESTVEIQPDNDRQVSIIGEGSIVSHRMADGHASLSFIINRTPSNGALALQADDSAMIGDNVGKLSLSPLSEFTLNHSESSFGFEVSYVMGHRHMATGDGSKRVMSMTIRELVGKLGEVEPYEPFWEDITELDLHDKQLASLHMLDEFCGRVVTLDASENKLCHLEGVPSTVRQLKACHNMLTELTSWDHLMNLQYMDISGNEVKSLSALKNLVHLRSVRADDNQLTSLDGLGCHDGLLSLRARNNSIEELDFSMVTLERLTELDLAGNRISSVRNLELLPALERLSLQRNRLGQLAFESRVETLRQLDVSDNELTRLDLGNLPSIGSVQADRNRICQVTGFDGARRLDSLSLREQHGDAPLDLGFLARAYEIRKLFLSGNYLGRFEPEVDFLNLQLLDLANCGLQSLPDRMGQLMPNLRTLNINLNAIADLSPLQFLPRLKKLLAAGNRLADSTAVTQLLTEFPHLRQLDVRENPVTLGLYGPVQVLVPSERCGHDPFTLPDADVARDESFASRLDEATRLRRRLHQVVLVASCSRLRKLDGLAIRRREVLAKDDLLETLVAEGLMAEPEETRSDESGSKGTLAAGADDADAAHAGDGGSAGRGGGGIAGEAERRLSGQQETRRRMTCSDSAAGGRGCAPRRCMERSLRE